VPDFTTKSFDGTVELVRSATNIARMSDIGIFRRNAGRGSAPVPSGTVSITFTLYENEQGGRALWSETQMCKWTRRDITRGCLARPRWRTCRPISSPVADLAPIRHNIWNRETRQSGWLLAAVEKPLAPDWMAELGRCEPTVHFPYWEGHLAFVGGEKCDLIGISGP